MSAIAGIFSRGMSGGPTETCLHNMLSTMQARFSDGQKVLTIGPMTLGLGWTNTSGERKGGPFSLHGKALSIVGDIRLDNREVLIPILGNCAGGITDSELVLKAYRRWGENMPAHLDGDFAFVIWDDPRQLAFCARDRFGIKPFYFRLTEIQFSVASSISALVEMQGSGLDVDEDRIADFLVGLPNETDRTAFQQIKRLPPGNYMTITRDDVHTAGYWVARPSQPIAQTELPDAFAELFTRSVANRMRGTKQVGVMLSGGLDSSSIACVARNLRSMQGQGALDAYSLVFERGSGADEIHSIQSVLNTGGFKSHVLGPEMPEPFAHHESVLREQSELFLAPGLSNIRSIYAQARANGQHVLLDGHGGDEVVSHGYGRLRELTDQGSWLRLWREACGAAKTLNISPTTICLQLLTSRFATSSNFFNAFSTFSHSILPYRVSAKLSRKRTEWRQLVNENLVHRSNLIARYSAARDSRTGDTSEQGEHLHIIANPLIPHAFEVLDRAAGANCIEPRYPFWDKELVLFCLGLPASEKLGNGWTRLILRQAMEGILPPEVQWRRDKADFTSNIAVSMLSHNQALMSAIMGTDADRIAPYVNMDVLRKAFQRLSQQGDRARLDDVLHVWRSVWLSLWLKQMERGAGFEH
ncbi:MAG: asparagine synthase-related protein [Alphaproteobacteria bacterium]